MKKKAAKKAEKAAATKKANAVVATAKAAKITVVKAEKDKSIK